MDSLDAILTDLAATLDVELQEGRTSVELSPEVAALSSGRLQAKRPAVEPFPEAAAPSPSRSEMKRPIASAVKGGAVQSLDEIAAQIAVCDRCGLHATRTRTVPGAGRLHSDILFIGEAPGAAEDAQGIPFVGRAGKLLTRMIEAMGYRREDVFIANILKCRPPENRNPTSAEMALCLPFLRAQIAVIQPKVIVALGTIAAQGLLQTTAKISQLRTCWHAFEGIPLRPTYHPSYLLRLPAAKRDAWIDLQAVLHHLGRVPPSRSAESPAHE